MNKELKKAIEKHNRLVKAYERVNNKLLSFSQIAEKNFHSKYDKLTENEKYKWRKIFKSWNWNNWHDLKDRIENRLQDNYSTIKGLEFQINGFTVL